MSWLMTFATALLSGIIGCAGMCGISMLCIKWYRISSFEGGSGYFMVLLMIAGALGGCIAGFIAARVGYASWNESWYAQLGSGVGTIVALLAIVLAVTYVRADHVPDVGGRDLVVAWEVRLPVPDENDPFAPKGNPADWPEKELRLQLVSVRDRKPIGSREAEFDRAAFHEVDHQWVLPARVPLFTSKGEFCVNLTTGGRDDGFWPRLTAFPSEVDFQWTPWYRTNKSGDKPADAQALMYRFRFEKAGAAK